ncbi:MAG: hypothetical protein NDJ75_05630 [Thermoanaerobaculia bacterium]|nr:hypothetical protein [Thermoanaerobaculia bacterium]
MAPVTLFQALVALVAGAGGALAVHWWRGLPWSLSMVVGVAVAVLAVSSLRTTERLRRVWGGTRRPR